MNTDALVDTAAAAHAVGVAKRSFHTWARRRGLRPRRVTGKGRGAVAYYALADVYAATRPAAPDPRLNRLRETIQPG